jgi:hypothetical protein
MKHLSKAMACDAFGEERQNGAELLQGLNQNFFYGESGAPGGTRTLDLLVRRFGSEILSALSVCQLRVFRFEIYSSIGLLGPHFLMTNASNMRR